MSKIYKVVLTRKIKKLGHAGDVVNIKPGYGRYLITSKSAVSSDHSLYLNLKKETKNVEINIVKLEDIYSKLNNSTITFIRKSSTQGMLHGSVTRNDIYVAICEQLSIDSNDLNPKCLDIIERFKRIGIYSMSITVGDNFIAKVNIVIGNNIDECNNLLKTHTAVEVSE